MKTKKTKQKSKEGPKDLEYLFYDSDEINQRVMWKAVATVGIWLGAGIGAIGVGYIMALGATLILWTFVD